MWTCTRNLFCDASFGDEINCLLNFSVDLIVFCIKIFVNAPSELYVPSGHVCAMCPLCDRYVCLKTV
jgi:hypothetical protein